MRMSANHSAAEDANVFLAGQLAPAGTYRLPETGQEVRLDAEGILPATVDGRVAVYEGRPSTWADLHQEESA